MNLSDLENLSGISYLFWNPYGDEEDEPEEGKLNPRIGFNRKYSKLSASLSELIEQYMGFSGYLLLDVE